jgi:16S rRNA processing protein RimM
VASRITPTAGVTPDGWVSLGVISRAHGLKGALRVHLWHDEGAVLRGGLAIRIGAKTYRVATYAAGILTVDGVTDRNASEALQSQEILVARTDFPQAEGDVYLVDLVGAPVLDESGRKLGTVAGISDNGAQPLLLVHGHGKEVMVPFVPAIVLAADHDEVLLRPPPGLFDEADAVVDDEETGEGGDEFDEDTRS